MPAFVYRIEHKVTHEGPYNTDNAMPDPSYKKHLSKYALSQALDYTQCSNTHPGMWSDLKRIKDQNYSDHYCGFESIEQLFAWFNESSLDIMRGFGFQLSVYRVAKKYITHGMYQVGFIRDRAKLTDTIDLSDLNKLR